MKNIISDINISCLCSMLTQGRTRRICKLWNMLAAAFLAAALVENLSSDEAKRKLISETSEAAKGGWVYRAFRRIQEIDIKCHEASTKLMTELDSWTENQQALVACCVSRARLVGSGSGTQSASGGGSIHPIGTVRNLKSSQIWQHPRWLIGFRKYYSIWNHHVNTTHITLCTSLSLLLDIPTNTIKIHH